MYVYTNTRIAQTRTYVHTYIYIYGTYVCTYIPLRTLSDSRFCCFFLLRFVHNFS